MDGKPWHRLTFGELVRRPAVLMFWYGALAAFLMFGVLTGIWPPPAAIIFYALLPIVYGGASSLLDRWLRGNAEG